MANPFDKLKMKNSPDCNKMLAEKGQNIPEKEIVLYSNHVIKINRKGKAQTRILLITNKAIYNLIPRNIKCKRRIRIEDLASITLSTVSEEFVLHVPSDYDYRFKSNDKENVAKVIKEAFKNMATGSNEVLPVQRVQKGDLWNRTYTKARSKILTDDERMRRFQELRRDIYQSIPMNFDEEEKGGGNIVNMKPNKHNAHKVGPLDFEFLKVIGRGAFAKVMQVKYKGDNEIYAMKILRKKQIIARNQIDHVKAERKILQALQHPFLVKLRFAFQSDSKLYFVLDYCRGGELFFHLKKRKKFTEQETQIILAEVALALGHLHSLDVIYRDLKAENVLLHETGHVCLTDFGLSTPLDPLNPKARTFCGTPEYLAPEIVSHEGHGKAVDWWSLGILCYELCVGLPPFYHQNLNTMYHKIQTEHPKFPLTMSAECQDLISQLLNRIPSKRLGGGREDVEDVKRHAWFQNLDWVKLFKKEIEPIYKPQVKSSMDVSNFSKEFTKEDAADTYADPLNLPPEEDFVFFSYDNQECPMIKI